MSHCWITGADGFIGRHLGHLLVGEGAQVCGLDMRDGLESGAVRWAGWTTGKIDHAVLDGLATRQGVPDTIFHLAGGSSVGASFADPFGDFQNTVVTTASVLDWMRLYAPHARIVFVSSAAVYGSGHYGPIGEGAPTHPFSPYGAHKLAGEMLCRAAADNFGTDFVVVRPFSVYGPGLRKQLLWDCCTRLATRPQSLELGGTGDELRDWLNVDDLVSILAACGRGRPPPGSVINAATGHALPVKTIVAWLADAFGVADLPIGFSGQSRAGDPARLVADVSRLSALGLQPATDTRAAVEAYVAWFRSL